MALRPLRNPSDEFVRKFMHIDAGASLQWGTGSALASRRWMTHSGRIRAGLTADGRPSLLGHPGENRSSQLLKSSLDKCALR
jgi:hypothetical protein